MAFPGYGAAIAYVLSWVDKLIPTKKEAVVDELHNLEYKYNRALIEKRDTDAAKIRKQMEFIRKRVEYANE